MQVYDGVYIIYFGSNLSISNRFQSKLLWNWRSTLVHKLIADISCCSITKFFTLWLASSRSQECSSHTMSWHTMYRHCKFSKVRCYFCAALDLGKIIYFPMAQIYSQDGTQHYNDMSYNYSCTIPSYRCNWSYVQMYHIYNWHIPAMLFNYHNGSKISAWCCSLVTNFV